MGKRAKRGLRAVQQLSFTALGIDLPKTAGPSIGFLPTAEAAFLKLPASTQQKLMEKLRIATLDPKLGMALYKELKGYHRITLGRIRCVYRHAEDVPVSIVLFVDNRKAGSEDDVYAAAGRLLGRNEPEVAALLDQSIQAYVGVQRLEPRDRGKPKP